MQYFLFSICAAKNDGKYADLRWESVGLRQHGYMTRLVQHLVPHKYRL